MMRPVVIALVCALLGGCTLKDLGQVLYDSAKESCSTGKLHNCGAPD